jgi:hypothetical protein
MLEPAASQDAFDSDSQPCISADIMHRRPLSYTLNNEQLVLKKRKHVATVETEPVIHSCWRWYENVKMKYENGLLNK